MKKAIKCILVLCLCLLPLSLKSINVKKSSEEIYAVFVINEAYDDGVNFSKVILANKCKTTFYTINGMLYMANIFTTAETASYGEIINLEITKEPETFAVPDKINMTYNWTYKNTYDDNSGSAAVTVEIITKPQVTTFRMKILTESLELIEYNGYLEGSLNFPQFKAR